jgi:hypothetical protein
MSARISCSPEEITQKNQIWSGRAPRRRHENRDEEGKGCGAEESDVEELGVAAAPGSAAGGSPPRRRNIEPDNEPSARRAPGRHGRAETRIAAHPASATRKKLKRNQLKTD